MSNKLSIRARLWQAVFPKEELDPTPVAVPLRRPLTLREEMQRFIRTELSQEMAKQGEPTFEEEDDFYIEDEEDMDIITAYTIRDDQIHDLKPEEFTPNDTLDGVSEDTEPPSTGESEPPESVEG